MNTDRCWLCNRDLPPEAERRIPHTRGTEMVGWLCSSGCARAVRQGPDLFKPMVKVEPRDKTQEEFFK